MDAFRKTFSPPIVVRSVLVAAVVGTILNAINQGAEIVAGNSVDFVKFILTYFVPFLVASYGAYSAFAQRGTDDV
ncbi:MAG: nitrate/nitrite transporter NrtS [Alphaproteobacteria bacterium]|nr:nitrate/nitrite transporter NrtS [Alphaproteobacteria bacterium]MDE2265568.1 nitrate/nitrite transporter NrtS [Alphaproteobacteria bacterium]